MVRATLSILSCARAENFNWSMARIKISLASFVKAQKLRRCELSMWALHKTGWPQNLCHCICRALVVRSLIDAEDSSEGNIDEFAGLQRQGVQVDVDAVKQGAGNFMAVTFDLKGGAAANFSRHILPAARAGVHRRDEHKTGWETQASFGPRDGDIAVFQRLAQNFQHMAVEFQEFIQE